MGFTLHSVGYLHFGPIPPSLSVQSRLAHEDDNAQQGLEPDRQEALLLGSLRALRSGGRLSPSRYVSRPSDGQRV
jgi:hypothetical protein